LKPPKRQLCPENPGFRQKIPDFNISFYIKML